jgi:prepilin-type N-terminal cleavage/methylation domain-containing protein
MRPRLDRQGFTLVELLVTMVVGAIILGATYAVMLSQQRFFARQTQIQDSRETLRAAAAILAAELRQASAGGGDFGAIASDSFQLRTTIGFGVICGRDVVNRRYNVTSMWGEWSTDSRDSVLVFVDNNPGAADDVWSVRRLTAIDYASPGNCEWGAAAQARVSVDTVFGGGRVGAQIRPYRWYVYKLYSEGGRYWLGRRRTDEVSYTGVVGPLTPPGANAGLVLTYVDTFGVVTADPTMVGSVHLSVRSQSFGRAPGLSGDANTYIQDTLSTRAYLRNN